MLFSTILDNSHSNQQYCSANPTASNDMNSKIHNSLAVNNNLSHEHPSSSMPSNKIEMASVSLDSKTDEVDTWKPIDMVTRIFLTHLGKVDCTTYEIEVGFTLQVVYNDPHLKTVDDPTKSDRDDWDDPRWFNPDMVVQNKRGDFNVELVQCCVTDKGEILREWKCFGIVICNLQLQMFPFDHLNIYIILESDAEPSCNLQFSTSHNKFLVARQVYKHPEFHILNANTTCGFAAYDWEVNGLDPDQLIWSRYTLNVQIARKAKFFSAKLGLVFACCILISMCSYGLPPSDLSSRLGIVTTMFLTTVAFQFVIADMLPKIPYLTVFDRMIQSISLILLLTCFEFVAIYVIHTTGAKTLSQTVDKVFLILNAIFCLYVAAWFRLVETRQASKAAAVTEPMATPTIDWKLYAKVPMDIRDTLIMV